MLCQKNSCLVGQHLFNHNIGKENLGTFFSSGMVTGVCTKFLGGKEEW